MGKHSEANSGRWRELECKHALFWSLANSLMLTIELERLR